MDASFIDAEITKLAPVAGQVLVLRCPPGIDARRAVELLRQVSAVSPAGVSVACVNTDYRLLVCNVPEVIAMLEKPASTH